MEHALRFPDFSTALAFLPHLACTPPSGPPHALKRHAEINGNLYYLLPMAWWLKGSDKICGHGRPRGAQFSTAERASQLYFWSIDEEGEMNAQRREALLKEYGEVSNLFRTLTDIRFKLLGVLPVASAATVAFGTSGCGFDQAGIPIALAVFGLATVVGVVTYNTRNDQLYNELVGRAAAIERSIGLPDGAFSNRPRPWLRFKFGPWTWRIDHGSGVATIYAATIAFWLYLTMDAGLRLIAPHIQTAASSDRPMTQTKVTVSSGLITETVILPSTAVASETARQRAQIHAKQTKLELLLSR